MDLSELRAWLVLLRAPGIAARSIVELVASHGGAAAALDAGTRALARQGLARDTLAGIAAPDEARIAADLAWFEGEHRALIGFHDPRYPAALREIGSPPPALFCLGDTELLRQPQIGIVGSRNATAQGLENAQAFAEALAARGLVVTSGLALGIDGAAHRGALAARNGTTVAVCATGLDRIYPARHRDLAHAIAASGLLVSEFLPGTAPVAEHFPRRNRLISGLSLGVLVVEAARESGSLITARLAAEQGREVFAIPGSIHNPLARGCHQLIRQGAKLVETVDDILVELAGVLSAYVAPPPGDPAPGTPGEAGEYGALLAALGEEPVAVDRLVERLGWPAEAVGSALLQLELEGKVASAAGGQVMRLRAGRGKASS